MFCSKCGTELPDGSQFCSKCGTNLAGGSSTTASVDTNKVLKEGQFRRIEKLTDAFSKKNDGTLLLYNDRLEWLGQTAPLLIPATTIKSVKFKLMGGDQCLEVQADILYKFFVMRRLSFTEQFLSNKHTEDMRLANVKTELDSWCSAIDKICGRL
jgi:hypothetical protein